MLFKWPCDECMAWCRGIGIDFQGERRRALCLLLRYRIVQCDKEVWVVGPPVFAAECWALRQGPGKEQTRWHG